ncbi:hypothetical protein K439DRAFT_1519381, partial [Ramaria rubella]
CCHCPEDAKPIEHRENNLLLHLTDTKACPNAPLDVVAEAHRCMMVKGKVSALPITFKEPMTASSSSTPMNVIVLDGDKDPGLKKRKRTLTLNEYVEQALTKREKNDADVALVRYIVYSNSALSCAENPYFQ